MEVKNTKAEFLLSDIDMSSPTAHIAYCLNTDGFNGNAIENNEPYLLKGKESKVELTEAQESLLSEIKKAEVDVNSMSLEDTVEQAIEDKVKALIPDIYISVWIEKLTHDKVYYSLDYRTYCSSYTVNASGEVTIGDDKVEVKRKTVYVEVEKAASMLNKNYAYTPDAEDDSSWKFRIDSEKLTKASVEHLTRFDKDIDSDVKGEVYGKVTKAYKEFFPEDELPMVLKSFEEKISDAASDNNPTVPSGIDNIEKNMSKEKETEVVEVAKAVEAKVDAPKLEDLQKSIEDLTALAKASQARAEAAEKEKEEIQKAAALEKETAAKEELTEVVKAWEGVENTEEVVEALHKASNSEVLLKAMEALHNKIEDLKKSFGEAEEGKDGDIKPTENSLEKSRSITSEIIKARNAKTNK